MLGSTRICTTNKPICKDLYPQIEKGVLELVLTFIRAGFCTISSCEGHKDRKGSCKRYVTLAFPKRWMADRFLRLTPPSGVFFEETFWSDSYYISEPVIPDGLYKIREKHFSSKTLGLQVNEKCSKLFQIHSNEWVLIQVSISPIVIRPQSIHDVWRTVFCRHFSFFYKFFERKITQQLVSWIKTTAI